MILYINSEKCSSVEQLKGYFQEDITPDSDIYFDLLDYGRHGKIAVFLREMNEPELATRVESIPDNLGDSAFYAQLKAAVTGSEVTDSERFKPPFDQCLAFECAKQDTNDNEVTITVILKVLMSMNEDYELSVSNNWGTRALMVNPYSYEEGKTANIEFTFRKRPGKEMGEITIKSEGKELAKIQAVHDEEDFRVGDIRFKMIRVEGGTFTMGATPEMKDLYYWAVHNVTLSSYFIGETPVTQALWNAVMGSNPSWFKGDDLPVESVSWNDCQEFIMKLNAKTGKKFRLPTEAEWEYAARGGIKSNHTQYSGSPNIDDVVWYDGNSGNTTHPVKTKKPNELGIYDMSGNVWEWCQDLFGGGSFRVYRGGSYSNIARYCRLTYRNGYTPCSAHSFLGFRLALSE